MKELNRDTITFLDSLESKNTKVTYLKSINDFTDFLFNKKLEDVEKNEIEKDVINYKNMIEYKNHLSILGLEGQTIRTKIYSVMSWLSYLYKIDYKISNPAQIKLERKSMPKINENNGSKPFTHKEIVDMIEKAKEYSNGKSKSLLLELAYITSWRKEALLSIKFKDIYKLKDNANYYLIDCIDKGRKEDTKPISIELYNRIEELRLENNLNTNDLIFNFTAKTCDRMIDKLKSELDIRGDKTFHSLRKGSINRVLDLTDNLILAKNHANHDNIATTEKFYIRNSLDYSTNVALYLMDDIDDTTFEKLTREELISLLKSSDDKVKFALLTKLKSNKKITN